jgi:hypothetical protein
MECFFNLQIRPARMELFGQFCLALICRPPFQLSTCLSRSCTVIAAKWSRGTVIRHEQDAITISENLGHRITPCSWFRTMLSLVHVSNGSVGGTVSIQNLYMY